VGSRNKQEKKKQMIIFNPLYTPAQQELLRGRSVIVSSEEKKEIQRRTTVT